MSSGKPKKPLKERFEQHPVAFVFGICVSVGVIVAGVVSYFWNQHSNILQEGHAVELKQLELKYDQQISELRTRIRAIERRVGGQKYLDVASLFAKDNNQSLPKKATLNYYEDGQYYAITDPKFWETKEIHEAELHAEILGLPVEDIQPRIREAMGKFHTRIWKSHDYYNIDNFSLIRKIFPYIMVQIIPYDSFSQFMPVEDMEERSERSDVGADIIDDSRLEALKLFVHSDAAGIFLTKKLSGILEMTAENPKIYYVVRNIQKVGPVVYLQLTYNIKDIVVNGAPISEFFVVNEWMLLGRGDGLFVIEIVNPTLEPDFSGKNFVNTNLWLGNFCLSQF